MKAEFIWLKKKIPFGIQLKHMPLVISVFMTFNLQKYKKKLYTFWPNVCECYHQFKLLY